MLFSVIFSENSRIREIPRNLGAGDSSELYICTAALLYCCKKIVVFLGKNFVPGGARECRVQGETQAAEGPVQRRGHRPDCQVHTTKKQTDQSDVQHTYRTSTSL